MGKRAFGKVSVRFANIKSNPDWAKEVVCMECADLWIQNVDIQKELSTWNVFECGY